MAEADTTAPTLTSLSFPTTVDVTTGGKYLTFTAGASDVGLGVSSISVSFSRSWQDSSGNTSYFNAYDSTDSFSDGLSSRQYYINSTSASGTYNIDYVYVYDKAGNYTAYTGSQLTSLGIQNSFTITSNAQADTTKPVLTSLSFPTTVDVTTGGKYLTFTAGASDVGLGVSSISVSFSRSWQDSSGNTSYFNAYDSTDSFSDGLSSRQYYINSTSASGTYNIDYVYVYDKAGNYTAYTGSQLTSLGIQNSFTIVDQRTGPTATVTAPVSVAEDGAGSFAPTLTLLNVASASTTVTMSFAAAQSTATNGTDVSVPNFSGSYSVSQSPAGNYTIALPSISVIKDQVAEGTETVAITIRASGQVFDTGTDTKTVLVKLIDSGQTGTANADTLTGTRFADDLTGNGGNDTLRGDAGDDRIDGGAGYDRALFAGTLRQSHLSVAIDHVDVAGPDGRDTAFGIEQFSFVDGAFTLDPNSTGAQVQRIYDTVLGRAPDAGGLDYWIDRIDGSRMALSGVASALADSAEFRTATGGLGNAAFVDYVYTHALGRAADGGGRDYWTAQLDGGLSRGDMLVVFSEGAEHRGRTAALVGQGYVHSDDAAQAVALLYDSAVGRLPDAGGLGYWTDQLKAGTVALAQVAESFAASSEFGAATAGKSNAELVDFMYANTLDRLPDAAGNAYWTDQLDHGLTRAQLLLAFSQGAEHQALMAPFIIDGIAVI